MHEAESMRFRVVSTGRGGVDDRVPCNFKKITLDIILKQIDSRDDIDLEVRKELKSVASRYPQQALHT